VLLLSIVDSIFRHIEFISNKYIRGPF